MRLFLATIMVLSLSSCAMIYGNNGNGYDIDYSPNYGVIGLVSVEYRDARMLTNEKIKEMENRLSKKSEIEAEKNRIPNGGRIIVTINRPSIAAANTEYFEFIVHESGKEILRRKGGKKIAQLPKVPGGSWWNIYVIDLPDRFTKEVTLYVVDNLSGGRDQFVISKPDSRG